MIKTKETRVTMSRALQFCKQEKFHIKCTAGTKLLTVMENGDLVPCRRMPIVLGNVLKENLLEIYKKSNVNKTIRKRRNTKRMYKMRTLRKMQRRTKMLNICNDRKNN